MEHLEGSLVSLNPEYFFELTALIPGVRLVTRKAAQNQELSGC